MNSHRTGFPSQLPLSWARTDTAEPAFDVVDLPFTAVGWIPTAEIPLHLSFDEVYQAYLSPMPNGFVLSSCGLPLRDFLIQQGCQVAAMGAEAVLDLPWRARRSVRALDRRGRRHGGVREIAFSQRHQNKLAQLIADAGARQGVQLRHIERPGFDESTRCFVFETAAGKWLGAITLSAAAPNSVHTELLLRHREAPVGVMEAMICAVAQQLAREGVQRLSLGNVVPLPAPESHRILATHRHPEELWTRSQLSFRLGRGLKFAHNAEGLWRFKNKFAPRWEPLYLCASPRLSWATIAGLILATGYLDLVWSRLPELLPVSRPTISPPLKLQDLIPESLSWPALPWSSRLWPQELPMPDER